MNWKYRCKEILSDRFKYSESDEQTINNILLLCKDVHNKACEEQKKICAENDKVHQYYDNIEDKHNNILTDDTIVDKDSILNSPNAEFYRLWYGLKQNYEINQ